MPLTIPPADDRQREIGKRLLAIYRALDWPISDAQNDERAPSRQEASAFVLTDPSMEKAAHVCCEQT